MSDDSAVTLEAITLEFRSGDELIGRLRIYVDVFDAALVDRSQFLDAVRRCAGTLADGVEIIFREH